MATRIADYIGPAGETIYIYPLRSLAGSDYSLADWTTHRVQLVEKASPNLGRYQGSADDTKGYIWAVFIGATQPASWDEAVATIDLTNAAIEDQTTKDAIREAMSGRWTDETNASFDLVVTETPAP